MEPKIRFKGFEGGWKEERLSEISSSIASGKNIDHKGPYPLYGSTGIIGTTDKPYHEGPMLLVARVGANAGFLQLVNEKCGVSDNTLIVKPKDPVTDNYLFQYFKFFNLNRFIYGSGQPLITGGMLKKMPVRYGLKEERETLIDYFTSLDSQISASTSRLASLKQMNAASLQAMFPQEGEAVPKIRFKGFEGEWTWLKLGDISEQVKRKAPINSTAPVMMISALNGFINQSEKYSDNNAGSSLANYTLLKKGELSYNHGYSKTRNFGSCFNLLVEEARIPFVYHSFRLTNDNDSFYAYYLNSGTKDKDLKRLVSSTARMDGLLNISFKNYMELSVPHPSLAEQQAIASYFTSLDRQISLQSQRLEKLKQIKSACLDKMFV